MRSCLFVRSFGGLDIVHKQQPGAGAGRVKTILPPYFQDSDDLLDLPDIEDVDCTGINFSDLVDALRKGLPNSEELLWLRRELNGVRDSIACYEARNSISAVK